MSNIAHNGQNNESIEKMTERYLLGERTLNSFKAALSRAIDHEQFARIMISTYRTASDYAKKATPMSWLVAAMECAQRGLRPDPALGEFYFVPRKRRGVIEIHGQVGYQGLIQLAYRGGLAKITARCVYSGDEFSEVYTTNGEDIRHVPARNLGRDKGDIILSYAIATLDNGEKIYMPVDHDRIAKAMRMSGDPRSSEPSDVWKEHPDKMWMKTAIRDLWPHLPRTKVASDVAGYVAEDFSREDGNDARPTVTADWARGEYGAPELPPNDVRELAPAPGMEPDEK